MTVGRGERVVVAMSGGVDSSVAAALLVEQGFEVIGVSMRLWDPAPGSPASGCCSLDDFLDARSVAARLGIPYYVMDFREEFRREVVDVFVSEYRRGRTPNPCARCNQFVKFAAFERAARELGATRIATGHYARRREGAQGPELWRAADRRKDQSYFLFGIGRHGLSAALFPLGDLTKDDVRSAARRLDLPVAEKAESQEICFAPPGEHARVVESLSSGEPLRPGVIVDEDGRVLGTHRGVHHFTIGQRRGLGLSGCGTPRYVVDIDADTGTVRVGSHEGVVAAGLVARGMTWLCAPPARGAQIQVKIRSRFEPQPAVVAEIDEDHCTLLAPDGLCAAAPGQAAVLYDGDRVLGGGWIERPVRRRAAGAAVAEAQ